MKRSNLALVVLLALYLPSAQAGFLSDLGEGYNRQARGFDDKTLIDQLNHPTWSWMWRTPEHVINEVNRRADISEQKASELMILASEELSQSEAASDYVVKTFEALLNKSQKTSGMSGEAISALINLSESQNASQEIRGLTQTFIQSKLKVNVDKIGEAQKLSLLKSSVSQEKPAAFEKQLIADLKKSSTSTSLLLQGSKILFDQYFGSNYKISSARKYSIQLDRRFLFANHIKTEKQKDILNASIEIIKIAWVNSKEDYEALKVDIDLVTTYAPKEMVAQIADKLVRIMETLEKIDRNMADAIASKVVSHYSSGGGGFSSSGSGLSGVSGSGGASLLYGAYREYSSGQVSSRDITGLMGQILKKKNLLENFERYSNSLDLICKVAARKTDIEVAKYCVNVVVPALISEALAKNSSASGLVKKISLSILTSLATYWDPKSLDVRCFESNNNKFIQAYSKFVKSLEGKSLKIVPVIKSDYRWYGGGDFEHAEGRRVEDIFTLDIKECTLSEHSELSRGRKLVIMSRESVLNNAFLNPESKSVTVCSKVLYSGQDTGFDSDDLAIILNQSLKSAKVGIAQFGQLEIEVLNQWEQIKSLGAKSSVGSNINGFMLLERFDTILNSNRKMPLHGFNTSLAMMCSKSDVPTTCRKNRNGSYACEQGSEIDVYVKAKLAK